MQRLRIAGAIAGILGLVLAGLWLGGGFAWLSGGPVATFRLPVPGKGEVAYTCRLTSTEAEAKARAEATHAAFQSRLKPLAETAAAAMQTAMTAAAITGDAAAVKEPQKDYLNKVKALRADLEAEFGCRINSDLTAPAQN